MTTRALCVVLLACLPVCAFGDIYIFEATMIGAEAVPPVFTDMSGTAQLLYDSSTGTYSVTATFQNLTIFSFYEDGFHIHAGAPGEFGDIIQGLTLVGDLDSLPDGTLAGYSGFNIPLQPHHEAALLADSSYVMVHTETHLPGEIRGQLLLVETVPVEPATWSGLKRRFLLP